MIGGGAIAVEAKLLSRIQTDLVTVPFETEAAFMLHGSKVAKGEVAVNPQVREVSRLLRDTVNLFCRDTKRRACSQTTGSDWSRSIARPGGIVRIFS